MKKRLVSLLSSVLVLILIFSLASCKLPFINGNGQENSDKEELTKEEQLIKDADEKLKSLDSYTTQVICMINTGEGLDDIYATINSKQTIVDQNGDDFAIRVENTTEVKYQSETTKTTEIFGFQDSKFYNDTADKKVFYSISKNDYLKYEENSINISASQFADPESISSKQLDDGGWEINMSGFDQETIYAFLELTGAYDIVIGGKATDMTVVCILDEDLLYESINIDVEFEDKGTKTPSFSTQMKTSSINKSSIEKVNLNNHTEIENFKMISKLEDGYDRLTWNNSGSYSFKTIIKAGNAKYTTNEIGRYNLKPGNVSFSNELFNDIKGQTTITSEYVNGKLIKKVKETGESTTASLSSFMLLSQLRVAFDPADFSIWSAKGFMELGDGLYIVQLKPSSYITATVKSLGVRTSDIAVELQLFEDEGEIVGYKAIVSTDTITELLTFEFSAE